MAKTTKFVPPAKSEYFVCISDVSSFYPFMRLELLCERPTCQFVKLERERNRKKGELVANRDE
jgi:hypothetical protein